MKPIVAPYGRWEPATPAQVASLFSARRIQVMLDETRHGEWASRRDSGLRRPWADIGDVSPDGVPYLAPEIQLYYKAEQPRPKDEIDFLAALPFLTAERRRWLSEALSRGFGEHPWQERLTC
ncbi:hypothetical protein [Actinomadura violacea]|uniref:Uncharacterized protein n=1 Tax=Actinomadura violacea TaxID=2819934 RepID=A0ABS3S386_9ACTN|nr:hypothetical protein [Actinomadura violacea]MBO2463475.1 hypothetical protein [Actinomadura violacea]